MPRATPADWPIGFVVLDKNDKIVVNRGGVSTLAPASKGARSPRLLLTSVALDPGEYTLRIAAVDDTGRGGSVHHSINARLNKGPSGINSSDLMLVPQPPVAGELPRPRPTTVIDSETVSAMLELTGTDQALLGKTKVTLQISDAENGNALVNVEARQVARGNVRAFAAQMRLGVLPPGEYVARAIIAPPGAARDAADPAVHVVAGRRHVGAAARSRRAARSRCTARARRRVEDPRAGASILGAQRPGSRGRAAVSRGSLRHASALAGSGSGDRESEDRHLRGPRRSWRDAG